MKQALGILLVLLVCGIGKANPLLMRHPAYISSERLEVRLLGDAAEIDGRFHFKSTAKKGDLDAKVHVYIEVPIWVPCDPKEADAATAAMLRASSSITMNDLKDDNRATWDSAIGLKITIGKRPLKIEAYEVSDPRTLLDRKHLSAIWYPKGFCCVKAIVDFQPEWLSDDPEIRIQYRQGLRRTRNGNEFHYVPVFREMPKDQNTRDLNKYSMRLTNGSDMMATFGGLTVNANYTAVLPLADYEPIDITLKPKS